MAVVDINQIKSWFVTLSKPQQDAFFDWIDSFRHKYDKININDLETALKNVVNNAEVVTNKVTNLFNEASNQEYPSALAVQSYVGTLLTNILEFCGDYDSSSEEFPTGGGSGFGGNINKADFFICTADATIGGLEIKEGDWLVAKIDLPGQDVSNWSKLAKGMVSSLTNWGAIAGDIGNQADLVTLFNLFAHYNVLIELNTTTPTGVLADVTTFTAALIGDNPNLVVNSYIQVDTFLKINCTGLNNLSPSLFFSNIEIVRFKDFNAQVKLLSAACFGNTTSLVEVYLPGLLNAENEVFLNSTVSSITILKTASSIRDIEAANGFSANVLVAPIYKNCIGFLTQFSNNAPTAIILESSLVTNPTYTRESAGRYKINLPGILAVKRWVQITNTVSVDTRVQFDIDCQNNDFILLTITDPTSGFNGDGFMSLTPFEIRVYP